METYVVTVRNAAGRERQEKVTASTQTSASNQALLRVERETGAPKGEWQVAAVNPAYPVL